MSKKGKRRERYCVKREHSGEEEEEEAEGGGRGVSRCVYVKM